MKLPIHQSMLDVLTTTKDNNTETTYVSLLQVIVVVFVACHWRLHKKEGNSADM